MPSWKIYLHFKTKIYIFFHFYVKMCFKPPSKVANKKSNWFSYCPELPKVCSKMWLIDRQYVKLGFLQALPTYCIQVILKVIYPKYSKHWPYTVAHTIDCSKMLNHGLFLSLLKLILCPIHWIVYPLAYLNFIFEF